MQWRRHGIPRDHSRLTSSRAASRPCPDGCWREGRSLSAKTRIWSMPAGGWNVASRCALPVAQADMPVASVTASAVSTLGDCQAMIRRHQSNSAPGHLTRQGMAHQFLGESTGALRPSAVIGRWMVTALATLPRHLRDQGRVVGSRRLSRSIRGCMKPQRLGHLDRQTATSQI